MMPVFEVVIVQKPTRKEAEEGGIEKLLYGPKAVVAKDAQAAAIGAVMNGDLNQHDVDLTRIDVLIRPFSD
jgi:hypothetical protein